MRTAQEADLEERCYQDEIAGRVTIPEPAAATAEPLIYVYELPPALNVWLYAQRAAGWLHCGTVEPRFNNECSDPSIHPSMFPGGGYVGPPELFLWERLLWSEHRTLDPNQADFFFVPALSRPGAGGFAGAQGVYPKGREQYWQDVVGYLKETWPFWAHSGGRDHIIVKMGDHGACESPRGKGIPEVIDPAVLISNWGLHTDTRGVPKEKWPYHDMGPCFRPGHDINVPAPQQHKLNDSPYIRDRETSRTTILQFAGKTAWGPDKDFYSNGVRQKVYDAHARRKNYKLVKFGPPLDMATSKFCLAPSGLGFGDRLPLVIAFGCIPVIIQDNITQPFETELPYHLFSIRVAETDIPQLPAILDAVTPKQLELMQAALRCVWPRFMWSSVYGASGPETGADDAFATLLLGLRQRRDLQEGLPAPQLFPKESASIEEQVAALCSLSTRDQAAAGGAKACRAYNPFWRTEPRRTKNNCNDADLGGNKCCPKAHGQPTWQPWPPGAGALLF
ncbi:hypothetical protein CYMTET_36194 [Cymbomonas tetramitiformis]|uniref:Exostosin GT47 domain-containing protein n=1 Tax=Cymbomonas tetramitiformis TaxID=36881 RepID=A0AAE0F7K7_9CHLO|nr:hypothetical protein CYMTET_36194 [Cymbomonas tetramitiformis]